MKGSENARPTAQAGVLGLEAEKMALRRRLRQARNSQSPARVATLSAFVCRHIAAAAWYQQAATVAFYQPVDNEVDPSLLISHAQQCAKRVLLPVIDLQQKTLGFAPYQPAVPLRTGPFGIVEPDVHPGGSDCVPLREIDILFLPLVGFDLQGHRIGFGGGYYDRTLTAMTARTPDNIPGRPLLVGLAYGLQKQSALPWAPHDVSMHFVVTEDGIFACGWGDADRKTGATPPPEECRNQ